MSNITIKQLRALVEVCGAGKATLAAQRLHVTPGALSQLLKQLESELGTDMFERSARRLVPTEAARHAVPIAQRILADLRRLQSEVGDFHRLGQGHLSVAATPAMVARLLPEAVMKFKTRYPGIAVSIDDCAPDVLWSLVSDGHCDLGVGSPDILDKGLEWDVLVRDRICVVCRPDDPLAAQRTVPWEVLREREFITVKRDSGIRRLIDQTLVSLGMDVTPAIEVNYLESVLALTRSGLAMALLPSYFIRGSQLVALPLVHPTVHRDILLLRKRGRVLSPAASCFRQVLLQQG